jgi:hypothetical protein
MNRVVNAQNSRQCHKCDLDKTSFVQQTHIRLTKFMSTKTKKAAASKGPLRLL